MDIPWRHFVVSEFMLLSKLCRFPLVLFVYLFVFVFVY